MRLGVALGICVACTFTTTAHAQPSDDATEARALFERGVEHATAESWGEALESFQASLAHLERPATRLNVGAALLRLGRFIEARAVMDVLLASSAGDASERARASELRARAVEGIRVIEVHVEPETAILRVDGAVREGAAASGRLELDPGRHRLEVRAEGYSSETRELDPATAAVVVRLAALPAHLRVRASVEGAAITIDGEGRGTTSAEVDLAPGRHELVVTAEAHQPFERWLSLTSGQDFELTASLERIQSASLLEDPWFWGVSGIVLAIVAGVSIGLGVGLSSAPGYDGGTLGDVLRPQ